MKKIYQDTTFYFLIFIIAYFIYVYPFEILNELLFNDKPSRKNSFLYTFFISALIIFYFRSKNTFSVLKLFIYEGMGIGFISFWVINSFLIFGFFFSINNIILGYSSLIIIFFITIYGLINGRRVVFKNIKIDSTILNTNQNFIFISDVHLGTNPISYFEKILKLINKYDYDFILIGGDLIDSSSFDISKLDILKKIKKPIFFVTGNHEYYITDFSNKISSLANFNITHLKNSNTVFNNINLIGINDNQTLKKQSLIVKQLFKKNLYNLVLVHKPSVWNLIYDESDLMLAGHTHNGQIFPFNFFVRLQFKHKYGLFAKNKSQLYVSSGAACWGPRIRFGTNNEIVYFQLKSNNN